MMTCILQNLNLFLYFLLLFETNKMLFLESFLFLPLFHNIWLNYSLHNKHYHFLLLFDTNKMLFLNSFLFLPLFHNIWLNYSLHNKHYHFLLLFDTNEMIFLVCFLLFLSSISSFSSTF